MPTLLALGTLLSWLPACGRTEVPVCGDGERTLGEQCDDGNRKNGDGCSARCRFESDPRPSGCGDGVRAANEECDDGNPLDGDGCSFACRNELSVCGNGSAELGEGCDDGNTLDGDGCSSGCVQEPMGYCGNGLLEGAEQCDDGNPFDGDGCSALCALEIGLCGNGFIDPLEQCDDGNPFDGDGCSALCFLEGSFCGNGVLEPGEQCDDLNTGAGDGCDAFCQQESCGNGRLDVNEECEDGNLFDGDGCSATCLIEAAPTCGNGRLDPFEQCDDGNRFDGDGCNARCRYEVPFGCGNGLVEGEEECDDANTVAGDGCSACRIDQPIYCGNGRLDVGEVCDDGNLQNGDGCDQSCRRERCTADVTLGVLPLNQYTRQQGSLGTNDKASACGGGADRIYSFELAVAADLELQFSTLGAGAAAYGVYRDTGAFSCTEQLVACTQPRPDASGSTTLRALAAGRYLLVVENVDFGTPVVDFTLRPVKTDVRCGNTLLEAGEVCDDGNNVDGDGCSADCRSKETCGNRVVDRVRGEVCDDGNLVSGDGCSSDCRSSEQCGNGVLDFARGEVCDDGNRLAGDGCSADCLGFETCGDGRLDKATGELCDDGNTFGGDGCSAACQLERCGNGVVDVGEGCDDGNLEPADGCDASCQNEIGDCSTDEELGTLTPGVPVVRRLDVSAATNNWTTDCGKGRELVIAFDFAVASDIVVRLTQTGAHNVGLYREGQATNTCLASNGTCAATTSGRPLNVRFTNRQAGRYYLVIEANGAGTAGVVDLQFFIEGCTPGTTLGTLPTFSTVPASLDTSSGASAFRASCAVTSGREEIVSFTLASQSDLAVGFNQTGDHVLGLYRATGGDCDRTAVSCFDPLGLSSGTANFTRLAAGSYYLIVDAADPGGEGKVDLQLVATPR